MKMMRELELIRILEAQLQHEKEGRDDSSEDSFSEISREDLISAYRDLIKIVKHEKSRNIYSDLKEMYQDAYDELENCCRRSFHHSFSSESVSAFTIDQARYAVKRCIPIKPLLIKSARGLHKICPECNHALRYKVNHCSVCGQAMDWGDFEENAMRITGRFKVVNNSVINNFEE